MKIKELDMPKAMEVEVETVLGDYCIAAGALGFLVILPDDREVRGIPTYVEALKTVRRHYEQGLSNLLEAYPDFLELQFTISKTGKRAEAQTFLGKIVINKPRLDDEGDKWWNVDLAKQINYFIPAGDYPRELSGVISDLKFQWRRHFSHFVEEA